VQDRVDPANQDLSIHQDVADLADLPEVGFSLRMTKYFLPFSKTADNKKSMTNTIEKNLNA
jgi:hypothetical protein